MKHEENTESKKNNLEDIISEANVLRWKSGSNFHDDIMDSLYKDASDIAKSVINYTGEKKAFSFDKKVDRILTNKFLGFPVMLLMLMGVFWLTIVGANYPSRFLSYILIDVIHTFLKSAADSVGIPVLISGFLFDGVYLAGAWVVSVMLPPMAIFFPLFTLLEDLGYLPRVAFNLDNYFRKVGAHGKQALTMTMGYGCNAAAVLSARIIDSPRERLIAIITNNFSLCNGRWPTQILISTIFIGALAPTYLASIVSASSVVIVSLLGVFFVFVVSYGLSKTLLKGEPSFFSLELPPYRTPKLLSVLYTSFIDRTLLVLWRAIVFAFPAGAVIWLISNIYIGDKVIAEHMTDFFDPFGLLIGLNGIIIVAYIVAVPANEIVLPTVFMLIVLTSKMTGIGEGSGVLFDMENTASIEELLRAGGWTLLTAVNLMLFSLLHNPCSTTVFNIYKETKSIKWTSVATLLPLFIGIIVCFLVAFIWRLFV